jgi:hypothetical protein
LLVADECSVERVYLICEPASHYYQMMKHARTMLVLIDQRI